MIAASRCFHNFPLLRCKKPGGGVHCIGSAIIYILWDFLPIIYYAELWMVSTSTPSDLLFVKNDKKMYIAGGSHRDACHFRPNRHHAKMCNKKIWIKMRKWNEFVKIDKCFSVQHSACVGDEGSLTSSLHICFCMCHTGNFRPFGKIAFLLCRGVLHWHRWWNTVGCYSPPTTGIDIATPCKSSTHATRSKRVRNQFSKLKPTISIALRPPFISHSNNTILTFLSLPCKSTESGRIEEKNHSKLCGWIDTFLVVVVVAS